MAIENVEELTGISNKSSKDLLQEEKEKDLSPSEKLELQFQKERSDWSSKIIKLASDQRFTSQLAEVLISCHTARQNLIDNIFDLNRTLTKLNNRIIKQRAEHLKRLTDTSKMDNSAFRYSDKDREKLIEAELVEPKNNLSMITNHLDFLRESVKTVDNMIWNIRYIINLNTENKF